MVELVLVLGILGIIFAVPFSGMASYKRSSGLNYSASLLESALFTAKQSAIMSGRSTEIGCAAGTFTVKAQNVSSGVYETASVRSLFGSAIFMYPEIFRFSSSGFPVPGYTGTAVIGNGGIATRKVVLSAAGRIRTE